MEEYTDSVFHPQFNPVHPHMKLLSLLEYIWERESGEK